MESNFILITNPKGILPTIEATEHADHDGTYL